jgi:hypothetical protein
VESHYRYDSPQAHYSKKMEALTNDHSENLKTEYKELENAQREKYVVHNKTRSDLLVRYFGDKVAPGVHDVAMRKEAWGEWKEQ